MLQFAETKRARFVPPNKERESLSVIKSEAVSVHLQERCRHSHRYSFVPVDKWMILRKALPKRRSLLNEVNVMTGSRSTQRRFERAAVPDAERASELFNQTSVRGDDFVDRRIERH